MKCGDLVKWRGRTSVKFPGPRFGILLCKWVDPHPDDTTHYWRVLMEDNMFSMDETYLEVICESR